MNNILKKTNDDANFQNALKVKLNETLDKAQKINFIKAPTVNKKLEEEAKVPVPVPVPVPAPAPPQPKPVVNPYVCPP